MYFNNTLFLSINIRHLLFLQRSFFLLQSSTVKWYALFRSNYIELAVIKQACSIFTITIYTYIFNVWIACRSSDYYYKLLWLIFILFFPLCPTCSVKLKTIKAEHLAQKLCKFCNKVMGCSVPPFHVCYRWKSVRPIITLVTS